MTAAVEHPNKPFTAALAAAWLAACSTTGAGRYDKAGVTEVQRQRDQAECAQASITAGGARRGFALFRIDRDDYRKCMTDRGYIIRVPSET